MCGIAGVISASGQSKARALAMGELLKHRGPDDNGIFVNDTGALALAHRRLSIVDLSQGGHQPMSYNNRYTIIYNGEIYNHIELRHELESAGSVFHTHSDTEVILAAYARWGDDFLEKLNGMFAFALFDSSTGKLILVRDRFGIKPLYYYRDTEAFYFASEIKAFTVLPGWEARINVHVARDFLRYGIIDHSRATFFENVHQLGAGQKMTLHLDEPGKHSVETWYNLQEKVSEAQASGAKRSSHAGLDLRSKFTDSVKIHLRSDVKVGSCLSGGLDSSSIVCVANELLRADTSAVKQETVTAASLDSRYDETRFAQEVTAKTETINHKVYLSFDELMKDLDRVIWHQDEPFASSSVFAQWSVFRTARREGILVMLDGQGADEQLAGYLRCQGVYLLELMFRFKWIKLFSEFRCIRSLHGISSSAIFRSMLRNLIPAWVHRLGGFLRSGYRNPDLFSKMRNLSLRSEGLCELLYTSLPMLLHYEDRNSMAHSVESRVPYLDYRLVEFTMSLRSEEKISNGWTKWPLREGMRGLLPDIITDRIDKMAFATPEQIWMQEHREDFLSGISYAREQAKDVVDTDLYERAQASVRGNAADSIIWRLFILGRWMRVFKVNQS